MIDLYKVKFINNDFDFIQATKPDAVGKWLCSETSTNYTKGFTYDVKLVDSEYVATRIDEITDTRINDLIPTTVELVREYLFPHKRRRCFTDICVGSPFPPKKLPEAVESIIARMVNYDIYHRGTPSELKSENIGNYSYTMADYLIGQLAYPSEIVSGLELFRKVRFL